MTEDTQEIHGALARKLSAGEAKIGIIGLGYVGLPLALAFTEAGVSVLGFDTDPTKVEALERGESYLEHIDSGRLRAQRSAGRLEATSELARLGEPDALLICVPTPLTAHREPDLFFVRTTAEAIAKRLRRGQLVVLESTTYPGTTEEALRRWLEASGLECGVDFFLAFSPEREDPGNPTFSTTSIPKIVGGVDGPAADLAEALYRTIVPRVVRVSSSRVAEATKLTENVFRAVNIALVNELKVLYDAMGIDVREVLDAAETKPFGFMRFDPGPGWGGHCIPVDPFYLAWKAKEHGAIARFIELAGSINVEMPKFVLGKLQDALNQRTKPLKGSRVLILGLAYKKNIADPRESPAFELIDLLVRREALVSYHDPHVPRAPHMRSWPMLPEMTSQGLDAETLREQDAVVVVTDHAAIDWQLVAEHAALIVDTRGVYREPRPNVVRA